MLKYALYIIPLAIIIGGSAFYIINKPPKSLKNQKPVAELSAEALFTEFSNDETAANAKYLDKVIKVTGKIVEVKPDEENGFKLQLEGGDDMFGISAEFDPSVKLDPGLYAQGKDVSLKGLCTGMLMDVVLVRCFPEN